MFKRTILILLLILWGSDAHSALVETSTNPTNIGIGTTSTKNALSIRSTAAIGSATYTNTTAPSNGLIVEGNVGVGTHTPSAKLEVVGTAKATTFQGNVIGNVTGNVTGNVSGTAGSLANNPSPCTAGDFVSDVAADGTLTCATPSGGGSSGWSQAGTTVYPTTSTDNVGIGTNSASMNITFNGNANKSVGILRSIGNAPGRDITISAGGAGVGSTDKPGGNVNIITGISTGLEFSQFTVSVYKGGGATGTGDNTFSERLLIPGGVTINDGTPTALFDILGVDNTESGNGVFMWGIANTDATEVQATGGICLWSLVSKAGVITEDIQMLLPNSKVTTGGSTAIPEFSISHSGTTVTIYAKLNSSLTASAGHPRITFTIFNHDYHNISVRQP